MPFAPLLSCGAPIAMVLPSSLMAAAFPACPVSVPPHPKWASSTGFEAFRYALCLNCPAAEDAEEPLDCGLAYATAPSITASTTTTERLLPLIAPPLLNLSPSPLLHFSTSPLLH